MPKESAGRIFRGKNSKSSYSFFNVNCLSLVFLHPGIAAPLDSCCPPFLCLNTAHFFPHASRTKERRQRWLELFAHSLLFLCRGELGP